MIVEKIKTFEDYALTMDRIIEIMSSDEYKNINQNDVTIKDDELESLTKRVSEYEGRAVT